MSARILIVEDEVLIALEIEAIVEDLGYEPVGIAPDAAEALRLAANGVDIALVDLHLRDGLTGPQIGKLLSEQHGASVVFVTANPRVLGDGVPGTIGVVEKPTDERAIGAAIDYAVSLRHGRDMPPPPILKTFGQSLGG
jgi:DNA-binding response OmpR family regulator